MIQNKQACDFILFGTQGDLARRKLLPALYQLERANLLHAQTNIIGVARQHLTNADYIGLVRDNLIKFLPDYFEQETWQRFEKRLRFVAIDLENINEYHALTSVLDPNTRIIVNYFATPPSLYGTLCQGLANIELTVEPARVVLEKPIGHDLASSIVINDQVSRYFKENQIYRIDHYLGKETVLNLLILRFANSIFATRWDYNIIDHVQITVAEEIGVEGRWSYYDDAGQLRDMVQNHLLQILSLIAMEPPANLNADSIRDEKLKVLQALRPINADNVNVCTVRGQYLSGFIKDAAVPGYLTEKEANPHSQTETLIAIEVAIDNWRWSGVPFYLRTGKRMPKKQSEVVIYFKKQPHNIFHENYKELPPNKLTIRLQPDEGVHIEVMNKIPGLNENLLLQQSKLDLSFDESFQSKRIVDAYERLLLEIMLGHQSLFVRRDEVEQAWKWVDGIISAWTSQQTPLYPYPAGSWGPDAATTLLTRSGRSWDE